jgi:uncharacterized protein YjaG (DUF416 family)
LSDNSLRLQGFKHWQHIMFASAMLKWCVKKQRQMLLFCAQKLISLERKWKNSLL